MRSGHGLSLLAVALTTYACTSLDGLSGNQPPEDGTDGGGGGSDAAAAVDASSSDSGPPAATAQLEVEPDTLIMRGTSAKLRVKITRTGSVGALTLRGTSLPAGVSIAPLSVAADATEASLTLSVAASAKAERVTTAQIVADEAKASAPAVFAITGGPPGTADADFGSAGKITHVIDAASGTYVAGLVVDDDGGAVVLGSNSGQGVVLLRTKADGTKDSAFGTNGIATWAPPNLNGAAVALRKTKSGALVVLARSEVSMPTVSTVTHVVRFTAAGKLDTSFGSGGVTTLPAMNPSLLHVLADDSVACGGFNYPGPGWQIYKLTPIGAKDSAFGAAGRASTEFFGDYESPRVAMDRGKGFVVAGAGQKHWLFAAYDGAGAPDPVFGAAGKLSYLANPESDWSNDQALVALPLAAGAMTVVASGRQSGGPAVNGDRVVLGAISSAGAPPTTTTLPGLAMRDAARQPDGQLVVALSTYDILRIAPNGATDTTFGGTGRVTLCTSSCEVAKIAADRAGHVVTAGWGVVAPSSYLQVRLDRVWQ